MCTKNIITIIYKNLNDYFYVLVIIKGYNYFSCDYKSINDYDSYKRL